MQVTDIFKESRKLAFVDATQFPDNQLLVWLNFLYHELCGEVKKINENYFYVRGFIDTVAFQNKYSFTLPTSIVTSVQKILSLSVKYQTDSYDNRVTGTSYIKGDKVVNSLTSKTYVCNANHVAAATFVLDAAFWVQIWEGYSDAREMNYSAGDVDRYNAETLDAFIDRYGKMIDINNPVYILNSVNNIMDLYIYPYVESVIIQGIKYDGLATILDLTASGAEADILIDRNYHRVLVLGVIPYIYQARGLYNEQILAQQQYDESKRKMLAEMTDRTFSATDVRTPNLVGRE